MRSEYEKLGVDHNENCPECRGGNVVCHGFAITYDNGERYNEIYIGGIAVAKMEQKFEALGVHSAPKPVDDKSRAK